MARYVLKNISPQEISDIYPFQAHYVLKDSELLESVRKRGVLEPVIIRKDSDKTFTVVGGHKRVIAAKQLGMTELPALEIQGDYEAEDLFVFSVLSNWKQGFSDFDKAWILSRAHFEFKIKDETTRQEILALLGLPAEDHLFDDAGKMMRLSPGLISCFAGGSLPFRGAQGLTRFSPADQEVFAREIGKQVYLTTNQLMQIMDWLFDLLKLQGKTLEAILSSDSVRQVVQHSGTDKRQKGEALLGVIKAMRYPRLTGREEKLKRLTGQFRADFPDMTIEAPASFEAEGFSLKLRLRQPESLDKALEAIKSKRNVLNSLFDFML